MKNKLFETIENFSRCSLLVVGDIILDEYIWGKATRLSPEAPVPVLEVARYSYIPGGCGNVASNIKALGGDVKLVSVIGEDIHSELLKDTLNQKGIDTSLLIKDKDRATTVKTRLIAHNNQQLARADREIRTPISCETEQKILDNTLSVIEKVDLVILSDYAKGVLTPYITSKIIETAKNFGKKVLIDPKGTDYHKYSGCGVITPNRLEAEIAVNSSKDTTPEILAEKLRSVIDAEYILITLGEDGVLLSCVNETERFPAVNSEVYDVTGAGDSLISALALGMASANGDIKTSIVLGNYAAGVAVRKIGTTAVSAEELKNLIDYDFRLKESEISSAI